MSDMDTGSAKRRRKRWPEALKREIVAATFVPDASVSVVARQYDVNANQVSGWRRRFSKAGSKAGAPLPSSSSMPGSTTMGLVPVTITSAPKVEAAATPTLAASDIIEIEVSCGVRIRVGSGFDGGALRRVLDMLRRS